MSSRQNLKGRLWYRLDRRCAFLAQNVIDQFVQINFLQANVLLTGDLIMNVLAAIGLQTITERRYTLEKYHLGFSCQSITAGHRGAYSSDGNSPANCSLESRSPIWKDYKAFWRTTRKFPKEEPDVLPRKVSSTSSKKKMHQKKQKRPVEPLQTPEPVDKEPTHHAVLRSHKNPVVLERKPTSLQSTNATWDLTVTHSFRS